MNMLTLTLRKGGELVETRQVDFVQYQEIVIGSNQPGAICLGNGAFPEVRLEKRGELVFLHRTDKSAALLLNGHPFPQTVQALESDIISSDPYSLQFASVNHSTSSTLSAKGDVISEDEAGNLFRFKITNVKGGQSTEQAANKVSQNDESAFYEIEALQPETSENKQISAQVTQNAAQTNGFKENGASVKRDASLTPFSLVAIYGPYLGCKFPVRNGETKIGRDTTLNDIVVRRNERGGLDSSISRRHATISHQNGVFKVSDKRSKTRTYVNQVKLGAADEFPVYEGDEIEIVSDKKSTIFRLADNQGISYRSPKKAGVWRIRYGQIILIFLSAVSLFSALSIKSTTSKTVTSLPIEQLSLVEENWQGFSGASEVLTPVNIALSDFDGDGAVEVVTSTQNGALKVMKGALKETRWEKSEVLVNNAIPITLGDLNHNNLEDILVLGGDGRFHALDGDSGLHIWMTPLLGDQVCGPPLIADFNSDGLNDVVIVMLNGSILIGCGSAYQINWERLNHQEKFVAAPVFFKTVGNKNAVLLCTENGKILILDFATKILKHQYDVQAGIETDSELWNGQNALPVSAADINGDEVTDIIIGTPDNKFIAIDGSTFDELWRINAQESEPFATRDALIAKIDKDDVEDVVILSNESIIAVKNTETGSGKQILWEYHSDKGNFLLPGMIPLDLNGDSFCEIAVANKSGSLLIINGANGKIISQVHQNENTVQSGIVAGILTKSKTLGLLYSRMDGSIYCLKTNTEVGNGVVWGQRLGTSQNTNNLYATYRGTNSPTYAIFTLFFLGVIIGGVAGRNYWVRRNKINTNRDS